MKGITIIIKIGDFLFEKLIKVVSTVAGIGYVPFAPGTAGTIAGIALFLILSQMSWLFYLIAVLVFTVLAIYISHKAEKIFNEKDPSCVVIDEMVGFQWTMFLVSPTVLHIFLGFILFRLFDIIKLAPAGYFQKNLPGGFGMVIDDVVAGIYGNLALLLLIKIWGI